MKVLSSKRWEKMMLPAILDVSLVLQAPELLLGRRCSEKIDIYSYVPP